jgi:hypothetical protein
MRVRSMKGLVSARARSALREGGHVSWQMFELNGRTRGDVLRDLHLLLKRQTRYAQR